MEKLQEKSAKTTTGIKPDNENPWDALLHSWRCLARAADAQCARRLTVFEPQLERDLLLQLVARLMQPDRKLPGATPRTDLPGKD